MKALNWIKANYWLVLILAVAAALRFYKADYQSLWADEVLTMNDINPKLTFDGFYQSVIFWEDFPHLYFFLLKYFVLVAGYTSLAVRLSSAVIGIFGVYAMYLLGRELFSNRAGLIAAALACVNIFHLTYSQEVRPYGMFFLFTALAFYRLSILIKRPTYKNAIWFGLFSGLIVNAHFFGLVAIGSQYALLFLFLLLVPAPERKSFFLVCLTAGVVTAICLLPSLEPLLQLGEIKSFWIAKPAPDAFASMFRGFFGQSEFILTIVYILTVYYLFRLFRERMGQISYRELIGNRLTFSFLLLFTWLFFGIVIPLVKSHVGVSVVLNRYFINLIPAILIIVAIGTDLIRNYLAKITVVACLVVFGLIDVFVVKDYYNTVNRTQLREIMAQIKQKNRKDVKIVAYWHFILPYFFQDKPNQEIEGVPLDGYVANMQAGRTPQKAFWYVDFNAHPYNLSPEQEAYMNANFITRSKLEYFDAWARYYVPRKESNAQENEFSMRSFSSVSFDGNGNLMLLNNVNSVTPFFKLKKGKYQLVLTGRSLPEKPIDNENAHIKIKLDGRVLADVNLSEKPDGSTHVLPFEIDQDKNVHLQLIYDNDLFKDGVDRNAIINSIELKAIAK